MMLKIKYLLAIFHEEVKTGRLLKQMTMIFQKKKSLLLALFWLLLAPFGLYLPEYQETKLYFVETKVTADCIVDILEDFWKTYKTRFKDIHTLVINSDNGPECHSRRTPFIKRICKFSQENNIVVKLAYYPPYHSKYNLI
jgi:hypothetical protein